MAHAFEFSVSLPNTFGSIAAWRDHLRLIEDVGFHTAVVADHFTDGYELEPMVALTAAAAATTTLRLQTGVLCNDYRHPVLTARMAATLDVVSSGRFTLGLGAGWMTSDYRSAGLPLDSAGTRVRRLEESALVIRGLLSGERLQHTGEFYEIDLELLPKTVQHPLPVFIGGGSPKVLAVAARHAQVVGVLASLARGELGSHAIADQSLQRVEQKIGWVRDAAAAVGRDSDDVRIEMNHWLVRVTDSAAAAAEVIDRVAVKSVVAPELLRDSPAVLVGTVEQIVDTLQARRQRLGISCLQLDAGFAPRRLDELAPIVAALAGR